MITYAEPTTTAGEVQYQTVITLKQKQNGWQGTTPNIGGMAEAEKDEPVAGGTATILYNETARKTTLSFSDAKSGS